MLLITCPWCGPREEFEFSYGGEAHIARPAQPQSLSDEQWGEYLFVRTNPRADTGSNGVTATVAANGLT